MRPDPFFEVADNMPLLSFSVVRAAVIWKISGSAPENGEHTPDWGIDLSLATSGTQNRLTFESGPSSAFFSLEAQIRVIPSTSERKKSSVGGFLGRGHFPPKKDPSPIDGVIELSEQDFTKFSSIILAGNNPTFLNIECNALEVTRFDGCYYWNDVKSRSILIDEVFFVFG